MKLKLLWLSYHLYKALNFIFLSLIVLGLSLLAHKGLVSILLFLESII